MDRFFSKKSKKEKVASKETKTETKQSSSLTISKSDGNIVTSTSSSTTSMIRQISTTSSSSETFILEGRAGTSKLNSLPSYKKDFSTTWIDALPFKAQAPRSAFTSEPLTTRSAPRLNIYNGPSPTVSPRENELRNKLKINVKKSEKFYDTDSKVPVYKTRSKHKGQLLIINNIKFVNEQERAGAQLDEENVTALFKEIGFQIVKYQNLSKKDMEKYVKKFRSDNSLKKFDMAVVIVMSHGTGTDKGDNTQIMCSDEQLLDTSWIINQFDSNNCKQLLEKPKIFIFQCCRGNNRDIVQHDGVPNIIPRQLSDMLIANSTIPGFVSHRDPNTGTWYIQTICKVFMEHAHDTDVENLLKIVDHKLSHLVAVGSRQTSSFENRGFKTCFLHPQLHE